ncbi:MAG: MGMT family protein [Lentisphaerae bacterium]|jgi:methylated-DNA-[protein]-cysteine S-methyltransferase|nr:MGMT family protein [Lentisphaerota bacterium]
MKTFDWTRVTPFQRTVLQALLEVPAGYVTTYGLLAKRIGCGSAQAVGQALGENPFAPAVPCHRVIASTLQLGGFTHQRAGEALQKKRQLLHEEGVYFNDAGKLTNPQQIWDWSCCPKQL